MAYEKDLQLSAKFAYHLNKLGMLDSLVVSYQNFRDTQNAPFEMKDKRIAIQSTFKGLCELYASRGFDQDKLITSSEILKEAKEIVKEFWDDDNEAWQKRPETESTKMVTEKIDKIQTEKDKNKKTYVIDIKGKGKVKDFHAECFADSKEQAYDIILKQHPGLANSSKSAVTKIIKLKK